MHRGGRSTRPATPCAIGRRTDTGRRETRVNRGPDRSPEHALQASTQDSGEYTNNRLAFGLRFRVLPAVMVVQLTTVVATTVVAAAGPRIASDLGGLSLYPWIFSG